MAYVGPRRAEYRITAPTMAPMTDAVAAWIVLSHGAHVGAAVFTATKPALHGVCFGGVSGF